MCAHSFRRTLHKPYENGETAARRTAADLADETDYSSSETVRAAKAAVLLEPVR